MRSLHKALALAAALATAALLSAGGAAAADGAMRPDDRATHGPGAMTAIQSDAVVRPDDRADRRPPGSQVVLVTPTSVDPFDWADAGLGALTTLGAVIVVGGAAILGLRRRPELA